MPSFRFEKLEVWQKSIDFCSEVYEVTASFPADERFGLVNQLRRAVVSISSNIAEGTSRTSDRDQARFVEIAYGSVLEVVSQLHISQRRTYIDESKLLTLSQLAEEVARMLSGMKANLTRKQAE